MAGRGSIVFAITARDFASKAIGGINARLSKMGTAGKVAAVGIGVAATAASALAALGIEAAKAAAQDERDTVRLNAALKARGILTDDLKGKIDEQTQAMAALGFTDDQVRAGIETGSRFFKKQQDILKANSVAADVAAVTGQSLSDVMMAIGRGVNGSTRGLTSLGIKVKDGAKLQDILTAATEKYGGASKEIANTTSGKFAAAQIKISEAFESLGYSLLPTASKVLDLIGTRVLPAVVAAFDKLGPVIESVAGFLFDTLVPAISELYDKHLSPLIDAVGNLATRLWGNGSGPLAIAIAAIGKAFEVFAGIVGGIVDTITTLIKLIERALELFGQFGDVARENPMLGSGVGLPSGVSIPGYGGVSTTVNLSIGQDKFDEVVTGSLERNGFRRGYGTP
jgi:hypothetical protein